MPCVDTKQHISNISIKKKVHLSVGAFEDHTFIEMYNSTAHKSPARESKWLATSLGNLVSHPAK